MRPGGIDHGMHPMHNEAGLAGGSSADPPSSSGPNDARISDTDESFAWDSPDKTWVKNYSGCEKLESFQSSDSS